MDEKVERQRRFDVLVERGASGLVDAGGRLWRSDRLFAGEVHRRTRARESVCEKASDAKTLEDALDGEGAGRMNEREGGLTSPM
jgi:hypothetical protein